MMMNLLLWRHAEAEDGASDQASNTASIIASDLARELTSKGERQARQVAAWLTQHFPKDGRILVSPAVRTRQTADALERRYDIEARLAPGASVHSILTVTDLLDHVPQAIDTSLLLVGHQPWIGATARLLLTGQAYDWSVRKTAVLWLVYRQKNGSGAWTLRSVTDPDQLPK